MPLRALGRMRHWLLKEKDEELPSRAPRRTKPEVVVHYWDGSAPGGRLLRDVSQTGAYIYTPERWYVGTIIRIILQGHPTTIRDDGTTSPTSSTCIAARVVRHESDGVAVEFVFRNKEEHEVFRAFLATIPAQPAVPMPAAVTSETKGQALVEFSLIIPLVLLLAVNAANFGGFIFAWITVANAARDGAQYMVMSSDSPGQPTPATLTQITALVTADVSSLLNRSSLVVAICSNSTTAATGCTTFVDPEATTSTLYTLATVDVTYTYVPFIPLFSFPHLGISATLPSSTIHRKAVMRMLQ
jgi:Flp pilus assembly protein TadG